LSREIPVLDPRFTHVSYGFTAEHLTPNEDSVPALLFRLGSETCNNTRVGEVLE
jgi:hypothetical protein